MTRRYGLRSDPWERLKDLLPGQERQPGARARDHRLFVEAAVPLSRRYAMERLGPVNTKIHASVDALGNPTEFHLTPEQIVIAQRGANCPNRQEVRQHDQHLYKAWHFLIEHVGCGAAGGAT